MLWFLVGQAVSGLPTMSPGTEVQVVPPELYPPLAKAIVEGSHLTFNHTLPPNGQIKLIFSSAEQKLAVLSGRVSPDGSDILIQMEADKEPVSFKAWLAKARHIKLVIPVAPQPQLPPRSGGSHAK